MLRSHTMPARTREGTLSFNNSRRFALRNDDNVLIPVTLPPGRARLAAKPDASGSAIRGDTIETCELTDFAAMMQGVDAATMTWTGMLTSSAASAGRRRPSPCAQR